MDISTSYLPISSVTPASRGNLGRAFTPRRARFSDPVTLAFLAVGKPVTLRKPWTAVSPVSERLTGWESSYAESQRLPVGTVVTLTHRGSPDEAAIISVDVPPVNLATGLPHNR